MSEMKDQALTVQDNVVVSMEYVLKVDGKVFDRSEPGEVIQFIQGIGQIIPGLETQLYGMRMGESKSVTVSPKDGYGELDEDAFAMIPRDEFPEEVPIEPGIELLLRDDEGEEQEAYIVEASDDVVQLNLNHPLAGKELHFTVKVVDLRLATAEEIDHGHVHES